MLRAGDQPVPGYTLQHFLGRGGFGEVWSALAPGRVRTALKFIRLEGKQGLKEYNSIQRIKNVQHPHLLPISALWLLDENGEVIDTDRYEGQQDTWTAADLAEERPRPSMLVLAMPLSDKSLFDVLEQHRHAGRKGIPPEDLLGYIEEVAKGLDYLNHSDMGDSEIGVQHCDIKPHNILLMGNSALICDFGLARVMTDGSSSSTRIAISPAYAAPECLRDNQPSSTSDQYSLAITYYELRTGDLPFASDSAASVYEAHLDGKLNLGDVSAAEQNVLHRATAKNASDRFPTTSAMVRELRAALNLNFRSDSRTTAVEAESDELTTTVVEPNQQEDPTVVNHAEEYATVKMPPQTTSTAPKDSRITSLDPSVATTTQDSGVMNWKKNKVLIGSCLAVLVAVVAIYGLIGAKDENAPAENGDGPLLAQREETQPEKEPEAADARPESTVDDPEDLQLLSPDSKDDPVDVPKPLEQPGPGPTQATTQDADAEAIIKRAADFFNRGNKSKDDAEVIRAYTLAINLNPADSLLMYRLYNRRAVAYRKMNTEQGDQRALDDFLDAAKYAPDNKKRAYAYFARGTLLKGKNRLTEAIEDFTQAIDLAPDDEIGYVGRAEAYRLRKSPGDEDLADQDEMQIRILKGEVPPNSA